MMKCQFVCRKGGCSHGLREGWSIIVHIGKLNMHMLFLVVYRVIIFLSSCCLSFMLAKLYCKLFSPQTALISQPRNVNDTMYFTRRELRIFTLCILCSGNGVKRALNGGTNSQICKAHLMMIWTKGFLR